jgi:hypothetical protein
MVVSGLGVVPAATQVEDPPAEEPYEFAEGVPGDPSELALLSSTGRADAELSQPVGDFSNPPLTASQQRMLTEAPELGLSDSLCKCT